MTIFQIFTSNRVHTKSIVFGSITIAISTRIILIINRNGRHHTQKVIVGICLVRVCVCKWISQVFTKREPALFTLCIDTEAITVESISIRNAIIVIVTGWYKITTGVSTTGEWYVVVLHQCGLQHFILPIGIILWVFLSAVYSSNAIFDSFIIGNIIILDIFCRIHQIKFRAPFQCFLYAYIHFHGTFRTFLGSNDNHTIGSTRTVNGSSRSILQNLNRFRIGRIEVNARIGNHSIDDPQRRVVAQRAYTTNLNIGILACTPTAANIDTGCQALHLARQCPCSAFLHFLGINNGNRSSQVGFLHSLITDDNHFLQCFRIIFHHHAQGSSLIDNFLRKHTDIRENECTSFLSTHWEITVNIGNGTRGSTLHQYIHAHQRLTICIRHRSRYGHILWISGSCKHNKE